MRFMSVNDRPVNGEARGALAQSVPPTALIKVEQSRRIRHTVERGADGGAFPPDLIQSNISVQGTGRILQFLQQL